MSKHVTLSWIYLDSSSYIEWRLNFSHLSLKNLLKSSTDSVDLLWWFLLFSLEEEMFEDVSLENHLEGLSSAPHHLQTVGVHRLLLVEDQSSLDPDRAGGDLGAAPADWLECLERTLRRGRRGEGGGAHTGGLQADGLSSEVVISHHTLLSASLGIQHSILMGNFLMTLARW